MLNKEGQRELAYVVEVDDVQPIEGYDKIRWATVNGWHCVVGLDIAKGDKCVYFETDSLLDVTNPTFAFCEKYKYRVKVQKYCKGTRISEGLLMPLSAFPQLTNKNVGDFVTSDLKITYYDPIDNARKGKSENKRNFKPFYKKLMKFKLFRMIAKTKVGNNILFALFGIHKKKREYPWFVPKTDEERIQNMPWILDVDDTYEITEKVDGCSSTYAVERDKFGKLQFYVCSRNVVLSRDTSAYYSTNYWFEMWDKYNIEAFLTDYINKNKCKWVYLQGETFGDGVQKRNYSLKGERDFRAFILCDSNHEQRFSYREVKEILEPYGIPTVPILGTEVELPKTVDEVMALAKGNSEIDGLPREGLVFRSVKNPRTSFKAVDPEFILKYHG